MNSWPTLGAQTVHRRTPANLADDDRGLYEHEFEKSFEPTVIIKGSWDSTPDGMLLIAGKPWPEPRWFQGKNVTWKARVKGFGAWSTYRKSKWLPTKPALVVTDQFSNGFFHWVADALPKLWWLRQHLSDVVLVLPSFADRFLYMRQSLDLWPEIETIVVPPSRRLRLNEVSLVPALAPTGNFRPELMRGLANAWRDRVRAQPASKLTYVSRSKAPWRKIRNEEKVWMVLQTLGFERVFLEELTFAEQVKWAAESRVLISNHGAGLTNLMFMNSHTKVLEIRLRGDSANNCYFSLASAVGVDYYYLLAEAADGQNNSHMADLLVNTTKLEQLTRGLIS